MNKILDTIKIYTLTYIFLISIFILLLLLTSCIPSKYMKENIKQSAETLLKEGNKKIVQVDNMNLMVDNYTEALMINTAYSIDSKNPFESILLNRKNYIPGITKIFHNDTNGELESPSQYKEYDPVQELYDTVNNNVDESYEYARYWHRISSCFKTIIVYIQYISNTYSVSNCFCLVANSIVLFYL